MKFAAADQKYLEKRKEISQKLGPMELWSVMDQWQLFCGIGNLSRSLAILDLFKESLSVPGHIVEFGSWRGSNLMFLTKLLKIYDPHGNKQVYCFDSFQGLSEFAAQDADAKKMKSMYRGSLDELKEFIELYDLQDDIVIVKGLIEDTLTSYLAAQKQLTFSLVYCDTDLYKSTKLIVDEIHPLLAVGGLIVFDEWNDSTYPGEGLAANEFMAKWSNHYQPRHVTGARQPTLVLKKLRA